MSKVFFITGTSSGFGKELVKVVLQHGHKVVATARTTPENYLATHLDVTDPSSIQSAFASAHKTFGRIDVVVNNAGYGLMGAFESFSDKQIRQQMDINFYGVVDVTREALVAMRERNDPPGGVIQQVTSIAGLCGFPTSSAYCASKWAVEGFTESVSKEMKPEWGIKFMCVEPGGFRTDWAGRSMMFGEKEATAYHHIQAEENWKKENGNQPGDPAKAAKAMYELAMMKDPPLRCVLGNGAVAGLKEKLAAWQGDIEKFKDLSGSTEIDDAQSDV